MYWSERQRASPRLSCPTVAPPHNLKAATRFRAPVPDVPLCRVDEIGEGELRHYEHIGYDLLLARVDGQFYCVDAACTAGWADLAQGSVDRERKAVVCPECGGVFSLETGQPLEGPPKFPLQVYDVHVVGDEVVVTFIY